jgi:hypothetical protein
MKRDGTLLPVRRGAYVRERPAEPTRDDQHRELVFATALQLHDAAVISHGSAAILHGLPIWPTAIDRVHVTRNRNSGEKMLFVSLVGRSSAGYGRTYIAAASFATARYAPSAARSDHVAATPQPTPR